MRGSSEWSCLGRRVLDPRITAGALQDFVRENGFNCVHLEEIIRELVSVLAAYREEDLPLFPEVFVFASPEGLKALAPGGTEVTIGKSALAHESSAAVLKNCGALALGGWAIFIVKEDEHTIRYGLFRALRNPLATAAEESMSGLGKELPVILVRNRGPFVVELRGTLSKRFTATLRTSPPTAAPLEDDIESFVEEAAAKVKDSKSYKPYLRRLLTEILQNCHGTLLAVIDSAQITSMIKKLKDGVWPTPRLELASIHANALASRDATTLGDLKAAEVLLKGMIASDGLVLFASDGSVVGYRVFLKPNSKEARVLPVHGGGRRRTYELMKLRLGKVFTAVFFRSQDGDTGCERSSK
jgi:hypothetical protein